MTFYLAIWCNVTSSFDFGISIGKRTCATVKLVLRNIYKFKVKNASWSTEVKEYFNLM